MVKTFINKGTLFAIILYIVNTELCLAAAAPTPSIVNQFYNSMLKLQNASNDADAEDLKYNMMYCFKHNQDSGINLPNDFWEFGYTDAKVVASNAYAYRCWKSIYSTTNKIKIVVKISPQSEYAREADLKIYKEENEPYIETHVVKTFTLGDRTVTFNDTILSKNNLIEQMRNSFSSGRETTNIEQLQALAASYFSAGKHKRAFEVYQQILRIDATNANAFYRLGILSFWHTKDCGLDKSKGRTKGKEYMLIAKKLNFPRAEQVHYYMTHNI